MNVLLLSFAKHSWQVVPDPGLGYAAAALRGAGHQVLIFDGRSGRTEPKRIASIIRNGKITALGMKLFTMDVPEAERFVKYLRSEFPELVFFAGGPHPSCDSGRVLDQVAGLDFAVCGEVEEFLPLALDAAVSGRGYSGIPNIIWKRNGQIIVNSRKFIGDLSGAPAWDLIDPRTYPVSGQGLLVRRPPIAPVTATRGCPESCSFCTTAAIHGPLIRRRKSDDIVAEIRDLITSGMAREIHFTDDHFASDRRYAMELCKKIAALPFPVVWAVPQGIRLDAVDAELLSTMKKSGCWAVGAGIESGSARVLALMGKRESTERMREGVGLIRKAGLRTLGYFILGYPGEVEEERQETVSYANSLGIDSATFSLYQSFPGTRSASGSVKRWEDFDYEQGGSPELLRARRWAFVSFYFHPVRFARFIWGINLFVQLPGLVKRLLGAFAAVFRRGRGV